MLITPVSPKILSSDPPGITSPTSPLHVFPPHSLRGTWALQRRLTQNGLRISDRTSCCSWSMSRSYDGKKDATHHWSGNEHLLRELGAMLQTVDRGGSITYHGPGQLIGYPIMKLSGLCPGPKT